MQLPWGTAEQFLTWLDPEILFDPEVLPLGMCPSVMKTFIHSETCI